jgi:5'-nucleotidase
LFTTSDGCWKAATPVLFQLLDFRLPDTFYHRGERVEILLTNDDGIFAPGLAALERELRQIGNVTIVAPAIEQSGVGHSVTYLTPLVTREVLEGQRRRGWAVEGSPADCVKLGVFELSPRRPDLVVSGINGGLNAGINVLYSGTVAAAIEGAFFGIPSIAVSLEERPHSDRPKAARLARQVIEKLLQRNRAVPELYNLNIPLAALEGTPELRVVPMSVVRYGEHFERRTDPLGRAYYWATNSPPPPPTEHETDLTALAKGMVTLTPLDFDLTKRPFLAEMESWSFPLEPA